MNEFTELELCAGLASNLAQHGFVAPTPVQAASIPPALEGRDVVATAQTGTGKTLAFALPIVERLARQAKAQRERGVQAVVLSPTRELAIQIEETFAKLIEGSSLRTATVVGGMAEFRQLRDLRMGAQIVIATPGRMGDFLERKLINLSNVNTVVLDEADRMLDMGFLPAIEAILNELPTERQTLLFSATIEKSVAHLVERYVNEPARVHIGSTTKPIDTIDLHVYEVEQDAKTDLLRELIARASGPVLVFARTKHGTDKLAKRLNYAGIDATCIHGDRSQSQRNSALRGFKDGTFRVLVATDVAARGIHVDDIAHVVNYDLPQLSEDFIHRVGRTGRAGARGVASTFATRGERGAIRRIERELSIRLERRTVADLPPVEETVQAPVRDERPRFEIVHKNEKRAAVAEPRTERRPAERSTERVAASKSERKSERPAAAATRRPEERTAERTFEPRRERVERKRDRHDEERHQAPAERWGESPTWRSQGAYTPRKSEVLDAVASPYRRREEQPARYAASDKPARSAASYKKDGPRAEWRSAAKPARETRERDFTPRTARTERPHENRPHENRPHENRYEREDRASYHGGERVRYSDGYAPRHESSAPRKSGWGRDLNGRDHQREDRPAAKQRTAAKPHATAKERVGTKERPAAKVAFGGGAAQSKRPFWMGAVDYKAKRRRA